MAEFGAYMTHDVWADCLSMSVSCAEAEEWTQFNEVLMVLAEAADPRGAVMATWMSYAVTAMGPDRALELLRSPVPGESVMGLIMRLGSHLPARDAEAVNRIRQMHERMTARGVAESPEEASEVVRWLYRWNPALDSDERTQSTRRGDTDE